MRHIMIYEYKKDESGKYRKEESGIGIFLQFGIDFDEVGAGVGNYSTAIVEMPDGTVENKPLALVRFLKE